MRTLFITTLVAIPSFVAAQPIETEIPHLDIVVICKTAGGFGGQQICHSLEGGAYNELKRAWPLASETTRVKALAKSAVALKWNNYYEVLLHYLDAALSEEGIQHPKPLNRFRSCCGLTN